MVAIWIGILILATHRERQVALEFGRRFLNRENYHFSPSSFTLNKIHALHTRPYHDLLQIIAKQVHNFIHTLKRTKFFVEHTQTLNCMHQIECRIW